MSWRFCPHLCPIWIPDRDPWGDKHQGKQQEDAGYRDGQLYSVKFWKM
jgi:hypothetical protein